LSGDAAEERGMNIEIIETHENGTLALWINDDGDLCDDNQCVSFDNEEELGYLVDAWRNAMGR
jgi:hypothetical protein